MSNELDDFAFAFREKARVFGYIPDDVVSTYKIQDVTAVVWYRSDQFQVEMFIVPPNYIIPEHTHPNVESYEMYLGGDICFSHSGYWVAESDLIRFPSSNDKKGALVRVRTNDSHGGVFGPNGGVFMSIQHWLNGVKPHSVALDYDGVVMGDDHLRDVKYGKATAKVNLTWKDAASLADSPPVFPVQASEVPSFFL
tara:strand:- start:254 stop:841 length:588 start_codon:yes stop_codon:yes gene_type:complete